MNCISLKICLKICSMHFVIYCWVIPNTFMVVCSCKHRQCSLGFHHGPVICSFDRRNTLYCTITHVSVCTSVHNTGCISVFTSKGTSVSSVVTAQEGITIFSNKSNMPLFYEDVHITSVTTDCVHTFTYVIDIMSGALFNRFYRCIV